jgi:carbamoyl-phosphate synthase large subunit
MRRNVLITAGSRRVPLVNEFKRAVRQSGGGRVVVTDVNAMSPAVHVADRAFKVPLSNEPGYVAALEHICREEAIGLLIPTIDDELEIIGAARERFEEGGTRVAASPAFTAEICNDKARTCNYLRARGIAAAESWLPGALPDAMVFPAFVKPRAGRGSIGAFPVRNPRELAFFIEYVDSPVVQEYLDGPEFTIDLLCVHGRPLSIVPRERVVIRAGVMDRGRTVRTPELMDLALHCAEALEFHGAVNIQCRIGRDGRPAIFEINPRFSGGIPLTIAAGADFPGMLVAWASGRILPSRVGEFTDGLWMTSYEQGIFIEGRDAHRLPVHPTSIQEVA